MGLKAKTAEERRAEIRKRLDSDKVREKMEASGLFDENGKFVGTFPVDIDELRYTMYPNDLLKLMPILGDAAWRVLCVIVRRTYGFHRRDAVIAYSIFMREGGIASKTSVTNALHELWYLGVIENEHVGANMWRYSVRHKAGGESVDRQETKAKKGKVKAKAKQARPVTAPQS